MCIRDRRNVDIEDPNSNEGEFIRLSNISRDNLISLHDKRITQKLKNIKSYDKSLSKYKLPKILKFGLIQKYLNCI